MVSYTAIRGETMKDFLACSCRGERATNLIASRIVMERYGKDLRSFRSELELLYAIRDAISGELSILCFPLCDTHMDKCRP